MPGAHMTSTTVCLRAWCFTSVTARASKIAAALALLALAFVAAGLTLRQRAAKAQ